VSWVRWISFQVAVFSTTYTMLLKANGGSICKSCFRLRNHRRMFSLLSSFDMSLYLSGRCIRQHTTFVAFYSEVTILLQRVLKRLINTIKMYYAPIDNIFNSVQLRFSQLSLPACCSTDSPIPEQPLGYNTRTTSGFISRSFSCSFTTHTLLQAIRSLYT